MSSARELLGRIKEDLLSEPVRPVYITLPSAPTATSSEAFSNNTTATSAISKPTKRSAPRGAEDEIDTPSFHAGPSMAHTHGMTHFPLRQTTVADFTVRNSNNNHLAGLNNATAGFDMVTAVRGGGHLPDLYRAWHEKLVRKEAKLQAKRSELSSREAKISSDEKEINAQQQDIDNKRKVIQVAATKLAEEGDRLRTLLQASARDKLEIDAARQELARQQANVVSESAKLSNLHEKELETLKRQQELAQDRASVQQRMTEIDAQAHELASSSAEIERQRAELLQLQSKTEAERIVVERDRQALEEERALITSERLRIEQWQQQLEFRDQKNTRWEQKLLMQLNEWTQVEEDVRYLNQLAQKQAVTLPLDAAHGDVTDPGSVRQLLRWAVEAISDISAQKISAARDRDVHEKHAEALAGQFRQLAEQQASLSEVASQLASKDGALREKEAHLEQQHNALLHREMRCESLELHAEQLRQREAEQQRSLASTTIADTAASERIYSAKETEMKARFMLEEAEKKMQLADEVMRSAQFRSEEMGSQLARREESANRAEQALKLQLETVDATAKRLEADEQELQLRLLSLETREQTGARLQQALDTGRAELLAARADLQARTTELERRESQIKEVSQRLANHEVELANREKQTASRDMELSNLSLHLEAELRRTRSLGAQLETKEKAVNQQLEHMQVMRKENEDIMKDIEQQCRAAETNLELKRSALSEIEKKAEGLASMAAKYESQIFRLQEDFDVREKVAVDREHSLNERDQKLTKAEQALRAREVVNEGLREHLIVAEQRVDKLQQELHSKMNELADREARLREKEDGVHRTEGQVAARQEASQRSLEDLLSRESALELRAREVASLQAAADTKRKQAEQLEQECDQLHNHLSAQAEQLAQRARDLETMQHEFQRASQEFDAKVHEAQQGLDAKATQLAALNRDIRERESRLDERMAAFQDEVLHQQASLQEAHRQVAAEKEKSLNERHEMEETLQQQRAILASLHLESVELKRANGDLNDRLQADQAAADIQRASLQHKEAELAAMSNDLAERSALLDQQAAHLASEQARINERSALMEKQQMDLAAAQGDIDLRTAAVVEKEQAMAEKQLQVEAQVAACKKMMEEANLLLERAKSESREMEVEKSTHRGQFEAAMVQLEMQKVKLANELNEKKRELELRLQSAEEDAIRLRAAAVVDRDQAAEERQAAANLLEDSKQQSYIIMQEAAAVASATRLKNDECDMRLKEVYEASQALEQRAKEVQAAAKSMAEEEERHQQLVSNLDTLQEQCARAEEQRRAILAECELLNASIAEAARNKAKLELDIATVSEEYESKSSDLHRVSIDLQSMETAVLSANSALQDQHTAIREMQLGLQSASEAVTRRSDELDEQAKELQRLQQDLSQQQADMQNWEADMQSKLANLEQLELSIHTREAAIQRDQAKLDEDRCELQRNIAHQKEQHADLALRLQDAATRAAQLERRESDIKRQHEDLLVKSTQLESASDLLKVQRSDLQKREAMLKSKQDVIDQQSADLKAARQALNADERELQKLREVTQQKDEQIGALQDSIKKEKESHAQELQKSDAMVQTLAAQLKVTQESLVEELRREKMEIATERARLDESKQQAYRSFGNMTSNQLEMLEHTRVLKHERYQFEQERHQFEQEKEAWSKEIYHTQESLSHQARELTADKLQLEADKRRLAEQADELHHRLAEAEAAVRAAHLELEQHSNQVEIMEGKLQASNEESSHMSAQIQQLEAQLQALHSEREHLEKDLKEKMSDPGMRLSLRDHAFEGAAKLASYADKLLELSATVTVENEAILPPASQSKADNWLHLIKGRQSHDPFGRDGGSAFWADVTRSITAYRTDNDPSSNTLGLSLLGIADQVKAMLPLRSSAHSIGISLVAFHNGLERMQHCLPPSAVAGEDINTIYEGVCSVMKDFIMSAAEQAARGGSGDVDCMWAALDKVLSALALTAQRRRLQYQQFGGLATHLMQSIETALSECIHTCDDTDAELHGLRRAVETVLQEWKELSETWNGRVAGLEAAQRSEIHNLEEQIDMLKAKVNEAEQRMKQLRSQLRETEVQLESQNQQAEARVAALELSLQQCQAAQVSLLREKQTLMTENSALQGQKAVLVSEKDVLQKSLQHLQSAAGEEYSELLHRYEKVRGELQSCQKELETKQAAYESLSNGCDAHEKTIAHAQQQLAQGEQVRSRLENQLADVQLRLQAAHAHNEQREVDLKRSQEAELNARQELALMETDLVTERAKCTGLLEELQKLRSQLQVADSGLHIPVPTPVSSVPAEALQRCMDRLERLTRTLPTTEECEGFSRQLHNDFDRVRHKIQHLARGLEVMRKQGNSHMLEEWNRMFSSCFTEVDAFLKAIGDAAITSPAPSSRHKYATPSKYNGVATSETAFTQPSADAPKSTVRTAHNTSAANASRELTDASSIHGDVSHAFVSDDDLRPKATVSNEANVWMDGLSMLQTPQPAPRKALDEDDSDTGHSVDTATEEQFLLQTLQARRDELAVELQSLHQSLAGFPYEGQQSFAYKALLADYLAVRDALERTDSLLQSAVAAMRASPTASM